MHCTNTSRIASMILFVFILVTFGCGSNEPTEDEVKANDSIKAIQDYQKFKADSAASADSVAEAKAKIRDTSNSDRAINSL